MLFTRQNILKQKKKKNLFVIKNLEGAKKRPST